MLLLPMSKISNVSLLNNPLAKDVIPLIPIDVLFNDKLFILLFFLKASTILEIPFKPTLFPFQIISFKLLELIIKFLSS